MADEATVLRPEFATFQAEIRSDMRDLRDGMVRAEARQDAMEKRTASLESQIAAGFDTMRTDNQSVRSDIQSLRSIRTWVIGGVAAGGSAVGAAIWHALITGIHS